MTDEDIIKACAEVDGRTACYGFMGFMREPCMRCGRSVDEHREDDNFLESYDAIIPLIQKQSRDIRLTFTRLMMSGYGAYIQLDATPRQLATALVKALGKWKE